MRKQFKAASLIRSRISKVKWQKFMMNEIQIRAHLAGLSCALDEVFILATANRFSIYALTDDIKPITLFFKKFGVARHVQFCHTSSKTLSQLLSASVNFNTDRVMVDSDCSIEQSYQRAKEAGSISQELAPLLFTLTNRQETDFRG